MAKPRRAVADSGTITVRVPITFRRRGGRKTVTTPDDSLVFAAARSHPDSAMVKALARAFRWRKLMETGIYGTVDEIAVAETINDSYVSRVLRLTLLAPAIVEAILDGRQAPEIMLHALMRPFSAVWEDQESNLRAQRQGGKARHPVQHWSQLNLHKLP